jgi:hypothetical protein
VQVSRYPRPDLCNHPPRAVFRLTGSCRCIGANTGVCTDARDGANGAGSCSDRSRTTAAVHSRGEAAACWRGVRAGGGRFGVARRADACPSLIYRWRREWVRRRTHFARAVPVEDAGIDPADPVLHNGNLIGDNPKHLSGDRRHTRVRLIGDDGDEVADAMDTLGADDPELRQMRTQRVDQHRPLPDQQLPCPVHRQNRLLLRGLHRDEAHRRPAHRFADHHGAARIDAVDLKTFLARSIPIVVISFMDGSRRW